MEKSRTHLDETVIALAFTESYIVPAATCIYSVLKNAALTDNFHFTCLLTEDFNANIKSILRNLVGQRGRISFVNMEGKLPDIYIDEKYTIAASYRLLLPELFPELDKVLYMDCDMVIQNNVAELVRNTNLDNYYMAGVFEATLPGQYEHLSNIGCNPGEYVNSGFLLMNLKKLRIDNMVSKFLKASKDHTLEFPDQDVINMLCKGKLLGLPPYQNSIRTFMLPQFKTVFLNFYNLKEWDDVQDHGNVHYTGPKPWKAYTVAFDVWWKYYDMLPEEVKVQIALPRSLRIIAKIYSTFLGKKAIEVAQKWYRSLKK